MASHSFPAAKKSEPPSTVPKCQPCWGQYLSWNSCPRARFHGHIVRLTGKLMKNVTLRHQPKERTHFVESAVAGRNSCSSKRKQSCAAIAAMLVATGLSLEGNALWHAFSRLYGPFGYASLKSKQRG